MLFRSIDEEDSLTERFERKEATGLVDIAVIHFPRISNFTDFHVLETMEGVSLRYVKYAGELGNPDMILLPGTKNTMEDLLWMRQCGLETLVQKQAAAGTIVFGICGGYQIMGEELSDPHGVERGGDIKGMGLLPVTTVFAQEKTRTRVRGAFGKVEGDLSLLSGVTLEGYEIHMGNSICWDDSSLTKITETGDAPKPDGAQKGNCYGTYVHGIFDEEAVAKTVISALFEKKGISSDKVVSFDRKAYKEKQYNILAKTLRESLDMEKIYEILKKGGTE